MSNSNNSDNSSSSESSSSSDLSGEIIQIIKDNYFLNNEIKLFAISTLFISSINKPISSLYHLISYSESTPYNSVAISELADLRNKCIYFSRHYDALQSIEISCVNPATDILSVTLFACVSIPSSYDKKETDKWIKVLVERKNVEYPNEFYSPFVQFTVHEFPVKIITKFDTNKVEFFDTPLLLCKATTIGYYVKINYSDTIKYPKDMAVKINYLMVNSDIRRKLCSSE